MRSQPSARGVRFSAAALVSGGRRVDRYRSFGVIGSRVASSHCRYSEALRQRHTLAAKFVDVKPFQPQRSALLQTCIRMVRPALRSALRRDKPDTMPNIYDVAKRARVSVAT